MTNSSTRIPRCEVMGLCEAIHASGRLPVFGARVLGPFLCVRLTLTYLRHNLPQELLAELYGVSQATVSRVISTYTPLIAACLNGSVPTVEDLDPTAQLIIDGTLLQCWSWKDHFELCSGEHKTAGLSVQVACALSGALAWVSWTLPSWGSDTHARVPDRVQATWTFTPVVWCLPEYSSGCSAQDQH